MLSKSIVSFRLQSVWLRRLVIMGCAAATALGWISRSAADQDHPKPAPPADKKAADKEPPASSDEKKADKPSLTVAELKVDKSTLPPPADKPVSFTRDIKPILDQACMDCHGAESPFGDFRLDTRSAALKGGEWGVDIIPGKSAQSPMIYYVALLVPGKEMPPEYVGDPLTKEQVGLLRAWIDQGAKWE